MNKKAARRIVVVASACLLAAACSTAGGKRTAQSGSYRLGSTGMALSAAAARNPRSIERLQAAPRPGAARQRAENARAPQERPEPARAGRPASDPFAAVWAQAPTAGADAAPEPRPTADRGAYGPGDLAQRTLSGQAILAPALSAAGAPAARAAPPAAVRPPPLNGAASRWMLRGPQTWVLAIGLALATLAAFAAAWAAARRRRHEAEPRTPHAANDAVPVEPATSDAVRAAGPQYVLPLHPAAAGAGGAPARTFSAKAGGVARLR